MVITRHHDLFVRDNPNFYLDLMLLVVNALLFLVIFSYPFSLIVYTPQDIQIPTLPCLQPIVLIGVFVLVGSFRTAFSLLARLRNPFSWTRDRIKIDSLLASTDRAVFVLLRSNFRANDRDRNDPRRRWLQRRIVEQKALERSMAHRVRAEENERQGRSNGNGNGHHSQSRGQRGSRQQQQQQNHQPRSMDAPHTPKRSGSTVNFIEAY
jgi:hypothetical protein